MSGHLIACKSPNCAGGKIEKRVLERVFLHLIGVRHYSKALWSLQTGLTMESGKELNCYTACPKNFDLTKLIGKSLLG